jgi:DNA invertase Pin-like site-specific DNA recombinase
MDAAISYKRFSTRKQASGDTERRQTDLAEHYCRRHDLQLLDTYLDAGLSGFTGANLGDNGALRGLLHAARNGKFPTGTRLIVESLDRLSRQEITTAVRLFLDILDTGLVIVTLIDGEQVFTKERVDSDLTALIIAIVYLSRANNESQVKRERARQSQQAARKKARENLTPITAECPRWLTLVKRRGVRRFVVNDDRARVVTRIFEMAAGGSGQVLISRYLNEHNVATFSGKPRWRPSIVSHLLASQAVLGRFHPRLSTVEGGRRRRVPDPEGPIENYFPAIVSEALFERARHGTNSRFIQWGRRDNPAYGNLIARLGRCAVCGGSLYHTKSARVWSYLRCSNAHDKDCSNRFGFPYARLEAVLLALDGLMALVSRLKPDRCGAAQEAIPSHFKTLTAKAVAPDVTERTLARRELIALFRKLIQAVVLHPGREVTVHLQPDNTGCRIVFAMGRDGILGVHVKMPEGTTGFIDRSVLVHASHSATLGREATLVEQAASRTQVVLEANGDWRAVAVPTVQIAELVTVGERKLSG